MDRLKEEALNRMEYLRKQGLMYPVFRSFKKKDTELYRSDRTVLGKTQYGKAVVGTLFYLNDEEKEMVKNLEEEYGFMVYHITHEIFEFGECYDLFIVSNCEDDWNYERELLGQGLTYAYVYNKTIPDYSEFGLIRYKVNGGGIIRTA